MRAVTNAVLEQSFLIEIDAALASHKPSAITRLSYLYPSISFQVVDAGIKATGELQENISALRKDVLHTVYREKIYVDTLDMRRSFYDAVTRR